MPIQPPHAAKPIHQNQTVWYNPTDKLVSIPIHVGATKVNPSGIDLYEVGPKEEVVIPSEYDRAVQVRKNHVIVQGLAPMLQKRGAPPARVHESIDADAQERKARLEAEAVAQAADGRAAAMAATANLKATREAEARKRAGASAQEEAEATYRKVMGDEAADKAEAADRPPPAIGPGVANSTDPEIAAIRAQGADKPKAQKPRGRPKGSKNKPKD